MPRPTLNVIQLCFWKLNCSTLDLIIQDIYNFTTLASNAPSILSVLPMSHQEFIPRRDDELLIRAKWECSRVEKRTLIRINARLYALRVSSQCDIE